MDDNVQKMRRGEMIPRENSPSDNTVDDDVKYTLSIIKDICNANAADCIEYLKTKDCTGQPEVLCLAKEKKQYDYKTECETSGDTWDNDTATCVLFNRDKIHADVCGEKKDCIDHVKEYCKLSTNYARCAVTRRGAWDDKNACKGTWNDVKITCTKQSE